MIRCDKKDCRFYGEGRICNNKFVFLNQFGQCDEYYDKNGVPRLKTMSSIFDECNDFLSKKEEVKEIEDN